MWHWKKKSDRGKKKTLALYIILYDYISKGCTQYVWYTHTQHFLAVFLPYFFGCHWGKLGGSDCAKNVHIGKYIGLIAATPEEHSIRRGELWRIASFFCCCPSRCIFSPLQQKNRGERERRTVRNDDARRRPFTFFPLTAAATVRFASPCWSPFW